MFLFEWLTYQKNGWPIQADIGCITLQILFLANDSQTQKRNEQIFFAVNWCLQIFCKASTITLNIFFRLDRRLRIKFSGFKYQFSIRADGH
jgi:hypothetical protein